MTTPNRPDPHEPRYDVLSPLSRRGVDASTAAPRIPDLNGKTVCELWDGIFRGETIYPLVREHIKARFPAVRFVEYTVFGDFFGARDREVIAALTGKLRDHNIDAVIIGIGA